MSGLPVDWDTMNPDERSGWVRGAADAFRAVSDYLGGLGEVPSGISLQVYLLWQAVQAELQAQGLLPHD